MLHTFLQSGCTFLRFTNSFFLFLICFCCILFSHNSSHLQNIRQYVVAHRRTFENVIVNICEDCMKDIPQRMGKPTEPEPLKKVKSAKAGTSGLKGLKNKAAKLQSNLTARFINETSARKPSISINLSSNKSSSVVIDDTPSAISTTPDPIPSTSGSGSTLMG